MKDCCSVYFKPGKCLHDILTKQDFRHGSKASVPAFIKMFQSEPGHLCVNIFVFKCPVQNISDFALPISSGGWAASFLHRIKILLPMGTLDVLYINNSGLRKIKFCNLFHKSFNLILFVNFCFINTDFIKHQNALSAAQPSLSVAAELDLFFHSNISVRKCQTFYRTCYAQKYYISVTFIIEVKDLVCYNELNLK